MRTYCPKTTSVKALSPWIVRIWKLFKGNVRFFFEVQIILDCLSALKNNKT